MVRVSSAQLLTRTFNQPGMAMTLAARERVQHCDASLLFPVGDVTKATGQESGGTRRRTATAPQRSRRPSSHLTTQIGAVATQGRAVRAGRTQENRRWQQGSSTGAANQARQVRGVAVSLPAVMGSRR